MEDNKNNPEYSEPMIDAPSKEEIITEKPYCDEVEAPAPILLNNNTQSQNDDNALPSKDILEQGNQVTPIKVENNNVKNFELEQPVYRINKPKPIGKREKNLLVSGILIIAIIFTDTILQLCYNIFSSYILADDILMLIMAIVYFILIKKRIPVKNRALGGASALTLIVGFGVRLGGMIKIENIPGIAGFGFAMLIILMIRTSVMIFCSIINLAKNEECRCCLE